MNVDPGGGGGVALEQIRVHASWWDLGADVGAIDKTAQAWRTLGDNAATRADNMVGGTRTLLSSEWAGDARDSFAEHLRKLVDDLDAVKTQADAVARHVDGIAGLVTTYQDSLDQARSTIMRSVPSYLGADEVIFSPADEAQVAAVNAAVSEAGQIRAEFDNALAGYPDKFDTSEWTAMSSRWASIVTGSADPFELPPEADGTSVLWIDGEVVVNTGTGDDDVNVTVDPDTGEIIVDVNGVENRYPPGTPITIRSGEGEDVIEVGEGVDVDLVLLGGEGNDRLRGGGGGETMLGGRGRDDLFGRTGNDYLSGGSDIDYVEGQGGSDRISGGHGNDTLYGLGSDNYLAGGEGDDYVEGGKGNDTADGGAGNDVISGGRGDDTVRGGAGDDVVYAGHGRDTIDGGSGADDAYRQDEDEATNSGSITVEVTSDAGFINIDGSDEFVERVEADLDMYRASPTGQQMLAELEDMRDPSRWPGQHSLTIKELENDPNYRPNDRMDPGENGKANRGGESVFGNRDSRIEYNPSFTFDSQQGRPSVVLYHEMAHVYSYWNGNVDDDLIVGGPDDGIKNAERQAVGLPYDHDGDSSTPDRIDPEQPLQYTENGLRDEMELPTRDSYR
jgi:hypothetical protein